MEKTFETIFILGASGGIGKGLTKLLLEKTQGQLIAPMRPETLIRFRSECPELASNPRLSLFPLDLSADQASDDLLSELSSLQIKHLDLVINCVGHLHDQYHTPEKSLRDMNRHALLKSFELNACTLPLLISILRPHFDRGKASFVLSLSAKVGSLEDNHLGGWYAYRASKAAHNMFLKTMAIEFKRTHPKLLMMAVHPGTTHTPLSKDYLTNIQHEIYSPDETAEHLWNFIQRMGPESHGGFYHWDTTPIPW